jgi:hypothetical protein
MTGSRELSKKPKLSVNPKKECHLPEKEIVTQQNQL